MKMSEVIQDVTFRARPEGVDQTADAVERLARAGDAAVASGETQSRSALSVQNAYERLQRQIDMNYRQQKLFEQGQRTLDRALQQTHITAEIHARDMALLQARYGTAAQLADRFGTAVKTSSANVGGIAAQFQDVAVQLAGGQSPFLIALQQGTQLSGQLEATGGGVKALGAAFLSLFSPMSLITIGGIAAFGSLVQYISSAGEKVLTLDEQLERHTEVIRKIKDAYGDAAKGIDEYAKESGRVLEQQLRGVSDKLRETLKREQEQLLALTTTARASAGTEQFAAFAPDLVEKTYEAQARFSAFREVVNQLGRDFAAGTPNIARFRDEVARVMQATGDPSVVRLGQDLLATSENAFKAEQALGGTARAVGVLSAAANAGLVALGQYNDALRSLQMGVPEMAKVLTAQKDLAEARAEFNKGLAGADGERAAASARVQTERSAVAIADEHARKVAKLNDAFRARNDAISGATTLSKEFADTVRSTEIAGMQGEARAIAQATQAYQERNEKIEEAIKAGLTEAQANALRAQNEKALAQAKKNAADEAARAAAKSGGTSGSDRDGFDNAMQRSRDQVEELRLQAEQASKTTVEVYRLTEAHRLRRAAIQAGRGDEEGITAQIDAQAEALARQRVATEQAIEAQRRMQESVRDLGSTITSFAEDVLTGDLQGALKSLGRDTLRNSLSALISGTGPLAAGAGLAPTDRGGTGGLVGLLTGGNLRSFTDAVAKGTARGSAEGFETGWHRTASNDNGGLLAGFGINGKDLAGGLTAIAGLAGSYGIGMGAGSVAQAGIGGALSGGLAGLSLAGTGIGASLGGAAVLGPLGLIAGAGLAIYGQQQAREQQKKERRRQALEAYRDAQPQIAQFGSQLRGDPQGTLAQRLAEVQAGAQKLGDIAVVAGRPDEAIKLFSDLATFRERAIGEFRASFDGLRQALADGTGPNSPFAGARDSVKSLGDQLKVFVDDAKTSFGADAPQIEQARAAARDYALSVLDGAREMSVAATRMEEIRGAAAGLQPVLTDLGMSATDAARAVQERTVAALARLKSSFETDLTRKTNSALDKGYLNDAADLIKELATLRADAAALGTDQGLVTDYFKAAAQSIVDGAELTGDAFADLIRRFPVLNGYIHEFSEKIDAATKAAEIAARRLGYQDRLFAALNDATTLEGQLAAFDRTALRDREAEIKAGGEAILDLEAAQAAERFNIIRDFNQKAIDDQKRAAEEARSFWERFAKQLSDYVADQRGGSQSPLAPQDRLAAAQARFAAQLALAQGGNRDALSGITGERDRLIDAARDFYASSTQFQSIWSTTLSQLEALPDLVSDTQLIIDAIEAGAQATVDELATMRSSLVVAVNSGSAAQIASALSTYFNRIDTNTSQSIDLAEMQAALRGMASESQLRDMFTRLDTDNSGSLSRLELIKNATQGTEVYSLQQKQVLDSVASIMTTANSLATTSNNLATTANVLIDYSNVIGNTQSGILQAIRALNDTSTQTLNALNNQFSLNAALNIGGVGLSNNMVTALNKIVYNTAGTWSAVARGAVPAAYATGGYVSGPGTGTSDSISARLSNGEFVMSRAAVDHFGVGVLDGMNDNFRMPAVPVPVPVMGGGAGDTRSVVAMLGKLIERIGVLEAKLCAAEASGAERIVSAVDVAGAQTRRAATDARQAANRPRIAGTRR